MRRDLRAFAGATIGPIEEINRLMLANADDILSAYGQLAGMVVPGLGNMGLGTIYKEIGKALIELGKINEPLAQILLQLAINPSGATAVPQALYQLQKAGLERYLIAMVVAPGVGPLVLGAIEGIVSLFSGLFGDGGAARRAAEAAAQAEWLRRIKETRRQAVEVLPRVVELAQMVGLQVPLLPLAQSYFEDPSSDFSVPLAEDNVARGLQALVGAVQVIETALFKQRQQLIEARQRAGLEAATRAELAMRQQAQQQAQSKRNKQVFVVVGGVVFVSAAAWLLLRR